MSVNRCEWLEMAGIGFTWLEFARNNNDNTNNNDNNKPRIQQQ